MLYKRLVVVMLLSAGMFSLIVADQQTDGEQTTFSQHDSNENKINSTIPKHFRLGEDFLKSIGMILSRLIGGQNIVCTALSDGRKITLDGSSSSG